MAPLIKRRTKIVSIRLLDDEYRRLKEMCEAQGARSVSDLARDAMFRVLTASLSNGHSHAGVNGSKPDGSARVVALEAKVKTLDDTVSMLRVVVEQLNRRLGDRGEAASCGM